MALVQAAPRAAAPVDEAAPVDRVPRPRIRLGWHVLAHLLLIVAMLAVTDLSDSWTPDDGAYATQVKVLDQTGGWAYPYAHADIDPQLLHTPVALSVGTDQGVFYPYVKLPAWILVLRASTTIFGSTLGLYVPAILGAIAAAMVAWRLARRFDQRAGPIGYWVVAWSPLLLHTKAMWAHTVGAALGGVCALLLLDAAAGRFRARHAVALTATLGALCMVRNEGLLLAAATLPVLAYLVARRRGTGWQRLVRVGVATGPAAGAALAARVGSSRWATHLAPGTWLAGSDEVWEVPFVKARFLGAARTLLDGAGNSSTATALAVLAVLAFAAAGRMARDRQAVAASVAIGAGLLLLVARSVFVEPLDLAGFAVASPLVVVVAAWMPWRSLSLRGRALATWMGLYLAAVLATQYPEGGARDWGGRFLFLVLVPGLVGAAIVARRLVDGVGDVSAQRALRVALVAAVFVPTFLGLYATHELRNFYGEMTDRAVEPGSPVVIRMPREQSRASWKVMPESDWLAATPQQTPDLLRLLDEQHAGAVTVFGYGAFQVPEVDGYTRDQRAPDLVVFTPVT